MKQTNIHEWFSQTAQKYSTQVALKRGSYQITYQELEERSNNLANFLLKNEPKKGSFVFILTEDSCQIIIALISSLKAGYVFVTLGKNFPQKRLQDLVLDINPQWIITDQQEVQKFQFISFNHEPQYLILDETHQTKQFSYDKTEDYKNFWHPESPKIKRDPDELCYLYFTSGSTGKPKAIAGRLKAISHFINWEINTLNIDKNIRVSQLINPTFDAFLRDIFVPLCSGGVVCIPDWETILNSKKLVEWIEDEQINLIHCVPSLFRSLLTQNLTPNHLRKLQYVLLSGEPLLPADVSRWMLIYGQRIQLVNLYGPSETTMTKFFYFVQPSDGQNKTIPIGKPMEGAAAIVVDQTGKVCSPGMVGEIYIRTPYRTLGYYQQPELTQEVFIQNPFTDKSNDIVYKTGDLGRVLEDGNFIYLGRKDRQVKIRGVRIELGEIENALYFHPRIQEAAVLDWEDHQGNKYLCAYVVSQEKLDSHQLKNFLLETLPEYMIPDLFQEMEKLPRTINGKIDKRSLPEPKKQDLSRPLISPRNSIEKTLAEIWQQVLGVNSISIEDNFFTLGGHSLLVAQVISRVEQTFPIKLSIRTLFDAPTVSSMAQRITTQYKDEITAVKIPRETSQKIEKRWQSVKLPLSFAQQRLWFLEQLYPQTSAYNFPVLIEIQGNLNVTALEQSLNEIIRRHEILRTAFRQEAGEPIQVIIPELTLALKTITLAQFSRDYKSIQQWAKEEASQPFDLTQAPLLRATLLQLDATNCVFSLVIHHIIFDAWSMDVLIRELSFLYHIFGQQKPSPLPDLPIQYADFSLWQRQISGEHLTPQIAYWKQQLGTNLQPLQLKGDYPRPPVSTFRGRQYPLSLSASLTQKLQALSQQQGVTLFMTLLAAFKTLLYRYSGQSVISVGTAIAGRNHSDLDSLIGCFVNTLVLRTHLEDNLTFLTLLQRVKQVAIKAYTYQDVPLEKLVEELQPERNLSYSPLFQVGFTFYDQARPELILEELTLNPLNIDPGTSRLDLTLALRRDKEGGLQGWLEYSSDLFTEATIVRWVEHWETLLQGIVANPEQPLDELPLLTTAQREQLLREWNNTTQDYPQSCIHQQFEHQVEQTPNAIALEFEQQQLTYATLNQKVNQLAHYLQKLGVVPEVKVGIYLERSPDSIIALLAILKAGGAYVPLDPTYPPQRLALMVENAQVALIISQEYLLATLDSVISNLNPRIICLDLEQNALAQESQENPQSWANPNHLAYIIYTSGSTGEPKGVLVEHRGLVNLAIAQIQAFSVNRESRILQFASLNFDASVSEIFMALLAGATLCMARTEALLPGKSLTESLNNLAITTVTLPPSVLEVLRVTQFQSLQTLILAGESAAPDLVKRWAGGSRLFNAYGPTEGTVCATVWDSSDHDFQRQLPIGRPLANTQVYILDHHLQPVPIGIVGELYLGGIGIARGYQGRPDLTEEKFILNPFGQSKLYKTGDLGRYLPNGQIEFCGRLDRQVKIRGFRIELEEIERVLGEHPQVITGVVLTQKNEWNCDLIAYVVPQKQAILEQRQLRDYLKQRLPNYMIPQSFVMLEQLPLTANGKIDYLVLPRPTLKKGSSTAMVSPRDNVELELVQIWEIILNHRPISMTENFFDLGGHSLLAVRLLALIEERFGIELSLSSLFQNGTIEEMALVLRSSCERKPWSPLVTMQLGKAKIPFFCVHPIGGNVLGYVDLVRYLESEQPFYGLQTPGMEKGQQPYRTISELAAYYLSAMAKVLPDSPYALGGHSFGGLVAFEMARQLEEQGLEVALLVIMDTPAPIAKVTEAEIDDAMWLVRRAEVLERFFGIPLSVSSAELQGQDPKAQFNYFLRKLRQAKLIPPDAGEQMIQGILQVQKASHQALLDYVPQVYPGQITLLRASEPVAADYRGVFSQSFAEPALGWGKLTSQAIQIYDVPGNHITMLTPPHVQVLARTLQACLSSLGI